MAARIIICVTAQRAIAAVFENGKLGACQEYALNEPGRQDFANLLRAHPGAPVRLMVDSVEEDYHAEVLPHVAGAARQELVRRKLGQLYRGTPYRAAWIQGREPDKRRDDHYLFVALSNAELLRPWLEMLQSFQSPLAGIYLLPMVTQTLVARLKLAVPDLLVVTRHDGGLRQSFFQGGQLKASRLAFAARGHSASAASLAADIGKTRLYLNSLRLTTHEAKLAVLLLDTDDSMEALQQCLQATPGFASSRRLAHDELSAHLGGAPLHGPHALHMTVLGMRCPAHSLAPPGATLNFRRQWQRRLLWAASAAVTAGAMGVAGANLYQHHRLGGATRQLETQAQALQASYDAVAKTFPHAPASAGNLEKAVRLSLRLGQDSRTPELLMLAVSRALENSPEITLLHLDWKFGAATQDGGADGWIESGRVEGEIRPFQGDFRRAMESVERFASALAQHPGIASVSVLQMPLDVHSSAALSGNTQGSSEAARAAFRIGVVVKARK